MSFTRDEIRASMLLYAVTDRMWLKEGESLVSVAESVLQNGATFLQIREKDLDEERFEEESEKLKALCKTYRVPFVVNDSVEIALQCDADGVHVGQSDMEAGDVRAKLGPDKIIGVSAQTVAQALQAEAHGADYLGVGAVFPTGSKADAKEVEWDVLRDICQAVSIPVVAIGGITQENVTELAGTGICGVAVISAIYAQEAIPAAAKNLKETVKEMLAPQ